MLKPTTSAEIAILPIQQGEIKFVILGITPFYFNAMSEKAKRDLLLPSGRKTATDKATSLKHDPLAEYRNSVDRWYDNTRPTRLKIPAPAFKGAMCTAALVMPFTKKAEIGRLVWVADTHVDFYGVPKLAMDIVRTADPGHTPDIRTRAKVEKWVCLVTVRFTKPNLTEMAVSNLLATAGIVAGVGDFRQEKGKGNYGQFRLAELSDPLVKSVIASGGRVAQDAALETPETYDGDTADLLDWYKAELKKRGRDKPETEPKPVFVSKRANAANSAAHT